MPDLDTIQFAEPQWLWLLVVPALLLLVWFRRLVGSRRDASRLARAQQVPTPRRFPVFGDSLFWLCLIAATALLVVALARPGAVVSLVRKGGVDLIILLDGSASMHVRDVQGDRWQRSVRFLRVLGDSLRWDSDRIALALFARIAAPQVRLTRDPNTYFFFLDHLAEKSPFPLEYDTSWDTNIEIGLDWGMRIMDKDVELNGASTNAPLFVLISDGQSWSGTIETALRKTRARDIPAMVLGVGSVAGGLIPEPGALSTPTSTAAATPRATDAPAVPTGPRIRSVLDRASLRRIADASGGQYLELDRDTDVAVANQIIDVARRRVVSLPPEPKVEEMYWRLLLAAGTIALAGAVFLRDRSELWVHAAGGALILAGLAVLLQ